MIGELIFSVVLYKYPG